MENLCASWIQVFLLLGSGLSGVSTTDNDIGEKYLMAFPNISSPYVRGVAGAEDGWYQIENGSRQTVSAYNTASTDISELGFDGGDGRSIVVEARNVQIYGGSTRFTYTPLPVSALGTKYIISSCLNSLSFTAIATHDFKADVNITLRLQGGSVSYDGLTYTDGETLELSIEEHRTLILRLKNDLTGTIITSTQSIAVYSGLESFDSFIGGVVELYEQLLPVGLYGQEYVVAVADSRRWPGDSEFYQMLAVGEESETDLIYNNGTIASLKDGVFETLPVLNESFSFTATKPVMVTLCRRTQHTSGLLVVPPVSMYTTQINIWIGSENDKPVILTENNVSDIDIKDSMLSIVPVDRHDSIIDFNFKVGWLSTLSNSSVSFVSSSPFAVLVFGSSSLYASGYNITRAPASGLSQGILLLVSKSSLSCES